MRRHIGDKWSSLLGGFTGRLRKDLNEGFLPRSKRRWPPLVIDGVKGIIETKVIPPRCGMNQYLSKMKGDYCVFLCSGGIKVLSLITCGTSIAEKKTGKE